MPAKGSQVHALSPVLPHTVQEMFSPVAHAKGRPPPNPVDVVLETLLAEGDPSES